MAQGRSINIISMIKWIRTSRLSIKNSLSAPLATQGISGFPSATHSEREIGNLLPNNRRQRRTCYALCHILYPVSAAHTSIFRMDSNSTSYLGVTQLEAQLPFRTCNESKEEEKKKKLRVSRGS